MFIGNNQMRWEDVSNTNTIRKLTNPQNTPKSPQFRNILISHCIRILHFVFLLLTTDHPGQTEDYIHPQLINPVHFAFVSCMNWTCRYGRYNNPWKPCCSIQLSANLSGGALHIMMEQKMLKLRSVKTPL